MCFQATSITIRSSIDGDEYVVVGRLLTRERGGKKITRFPILERSIPLEGVDQSRVVPDETVSKCAK